MEDIVEVPLSEIEGKFCACGKPAKMECRTGVAPDVWTEPKYCCDECWRDELPTIQP